MTEKKFQVFISSTYTDLVEERKAVEETIIRAGDFPVGMEAFPAADEEQFEFIKTVINKCDYYVLVIAGRYGSIAEDGLSYTEKEYDYAVKEGIPVLVMLRDNRGELAADKSEESDDGRTKLGAFIEKASTGRIRKGWTSVDGLKLSVREALDYAKATKPRPGWIRGDTAASTETLAENNKLRNEIDELRTEVKQVQPIFDDLEDMNEPLEITGTRYVASTIYTDAGTISWSIESSILKVFSLMAPQLIDSPSDTMSNEIMATVLCHEKGLKGDSSYKVDNQTFQTIKIQLEALGLIKVERAPTVGGSYGVFWNLTKAGKAKMLELRVLRASKINAN